MVATIAIIPSDPQFIINTTNSIQLKNFQNEYY